MELSPEQLVETVVRAVLAELARRGVVIAPPISMPSSVESRRSVEIDFSEYKTPVLTEMHVRGTAREVREIVVPAGTICTTGAKDLMQQRRMRLTIKAVSLKEE